MGTKLAILVYQPFFSQFSIKTALLLKRIPWLGISFSARESGRGVGPAVWLYWCVWGGGGARDLTCLEC